ncbi:MAG: sulfotransferase domain-containing protein [Gammaproteobacteria bacterium]
MMKHFLSQLFKGNTRKQFVTVVSGLPRSGTSMMMKMLEAGGILPMTDNIRTADLDNPNGYYEFERVKQLDKGDKAWVKEAHGKVVKVITQLLRHLPADCEYRIVFMRRSMSEIIASQNKMLINRGQEPNATTDEETASLFEKHLAHVTKWIQRQANVSVIYVDYGDMFKDPELQIRRINEFLGGDMNTEEMLRVADPQLYRNRKTEVA